MSSVESKQKNPALNIVLWIIVIALIIAVPVINSVYAEESLLYRVMAGLALAVVACFIAAQTTQGAAFWFIAKGARTEVRRVVWPNRDERNKATLLVVGVVAFMAVVLWALDGILGWLAGMLLG